MFRTIEMREKFVGIVGLIVMLAFVLAACDDSNETDPNESLASPFLIGADLSFQPEIMDEQTSYYNEEGEKVEMLSFLKSKGVNIIRLRLWHTPDNQRSTLEEVLEYSKAVKAAGLQILLDIHYSDHWADPGTQTMPKLWNRLSFPNLNDSVFQYTFKVVNSFITRDLPITMVQIGNETNSGFLWDKGRVGGNFDSNWSNYVNLLNSAIDGLKAADTTGKISTLIHYAGTQGANWYFDELHARNVDFDIIGLSYYPFWHGKDLNAVSSEWDNLHNRYDKKVFIVETAYPFTLQWNDFTNNLVGLESQLIDGIAASPEGQVVFIEQVKAEIKLLTNEKVVGYCWWAPDWVAFRGSQSTNGSSWENCTWFDFTNQALPIVDNLKIENDN